MEHEQHALVYASIPGGTDLLNWFGQVPSFHDAEILDLHLTRRGTSTLRIECWNTSTKIRCGYYVLEKHAVVEFSLSRITDLALNDFNHQNVIGGLVLSRYGTDEGPTGFQISLEHCYGLGGIIRAETVSVNHSPSKPE